LTPETAVKVGALTEWHVSAYIELQQRISFLESEVPKMEAQQERLRRHVEETLPADFDMSFMTNKAKLEKWIGNAVRSGEYGEIPHKGLGSMIKRVYADFRDKYGDIMDTYREHSANLKSLKKEYDSIPEDKDGIKTGKLTNLSETRFEINPNTAEKVATLNIDPKALYDTANKSLKSIVGQLVQIQKDYRDTVREMHSYLSTLSNATAAGFKKEVAEFDQSVRKIEDSTQCEPDFLK
jgi:flagellar biosynthesis chaperone FliJ